MERSTTDASFMSSQSSSSAGAAATNGSVTPSQQPASEYAIPGIPAATGATFGVDLGEQLSRDGIEVPKIVEKCAQAIEEYGKLITTISLGSKR